MGVLEKTVQLPGGVEMNTIYLLLFGVIGLFALIYGGALLLRRG